VKKLRNREIEEAVENLETLDELILDEHKSFKSLLRMMFEIDPTERPSCSACLEHEFFNINNL
jgi:serine/threonine protein kinase